jgi:hypothetical protein
VIRGCPGRRTDGQLLCRTLLPNPVPSQKMPEGLLPWAVLSRTVLWAGSAPVVDLVEMMTMAPWATDAAAVTMPLTLLSSTRVSWKPARAMPIPGGRRAGTARAGHLVGPDLVVRDGVVVRWQVAGRAPAGVQVQDADAVTPRLVVGGSQVRAVAHEDTQPVVIAAVVAGHAVPVRTVTHAQAGLGVPRWFNVGQLVIGGCTLPPQ